MAEYLGVLVEIEGQVRRAMLAGSALEALEALRDLERKVGEARSVIRAQIAQETPKGATRVVFEGGRQVSI